MKISQIYPKGTRLENQEVKITQTPNVKLKVSFEF